MRNKEEILKDKLAKKDEEIRQLKDKLSKTQNDLDLARLSKEMIKAKADEMINACEKTMITLNDSLKELDDLKKEYKKMIEEMKETQSNQKKDYKSLIKKIRKCK